MFEHNFSFAEACDFRRRYFRRFSPPTHSFDEATMEIDTWEKQQLVTELEATKTKAKSENRLFSFRPSSQLKFVRPFQSALLDGFRRSIRKTSWGVSSSLVNNLKFT